MHLSYRPLFFFVMTLASCSLAIDPPPSVLNECTTDAECPGARCDTSLGMCLTPSTAPLTVGFEIVPPASSNGLLAIPRVIDGRELTGPAEIDFALEGQIAVVGDLCAVRAGTTECAEHVHASLKFVGAGLTGPIVAFEATTNDPMMAPDGQPADYIARLIRDRDYDVIIEPVGEVARRRHPIRRTFHTPAQGDIVRFQFLHWADAQPFLGNVIDELEQPMSGLDVRAIDRATGALVSSVAVTDENGDFELSIEPGANYLIQLTGGEGRPVFPTFTQDPDFFYPIPERKQILVPAANGIEYGGTVQARGSPGAVVADATVMFRALDVTRSENGLGGSFSTTVRTDEEGEFRATLLPGTYDVLVTPPPSLMMGLTSDLGVQVQTGLIIEEGAVGMAFELPPRVRLSGSVSTPDGRTMEGARVHAIALQREVAGVRAAEYNRSSDEVTDPMGGFVFPVDAGVYDLVAKPPAASRFPWSVRLADALVGPDDSSRPSVERSFQFEAPLPVRGRVLDATDVPIEGAEIRAFGIVIEGGVTRAVEIGRAVSSETGEYVLLLPPTL
jgi:hypothetical protein